jgi:hypothetical protein
MLGLAEAGLATFNIYISRVKKIPAVHTMNQVD